MADDFEAFLAAYRAVAERAAGPTKFWMGEVLREMERQRDEGDGRE